VKFLLLMILVVAGTAQADIAQKMVLINCSDADPATTSVLVLSVQVDDSEYMDAEKVKAYAEDGLFLLVDYKNRELRTATKECTVGNRKVKVVVTFGTHFTAGKCANDPGGTIELFVDDQPVKELYQGDSPAAFDETCRSEVASVVDLNYMPLTNTVWVNQRAAGQDFPSLEEAYLFKLPTP